MKSSITFVIVLFWVLPSTYAQSRIGTYFWNQSVLMLECNINGVPLKNGAGDPVQVSSMIQQRFKVLKVDSGMAVIKVLNYDYDKNEAFLLRYNVNKTAYLNAGHTFKKGVAPKFYEFYNCQKYFKVAISHLDSFATKMEFVPLSLTTGAFNVPFKLRPPLYGNATDFSGAFNFGAAVGLKFDHYKHKKWRNSLVLGFSVSNINLDASVVTKNAAQLAENNGFSTLSLSFGWLVEYERAQLGIFVGADHLNRLNQDTYNWKYQGRPWVSIGIGMLIFSPENTVDEDINSQR